MGVSHTVEQRSFWFLWEKRGQGITKKHGYNAFGDGEAMHIDVCLYELSGLAEKEIMQHLH